MEDLKKLKVKSHKYTQQDFMKRFMKPTTKVNFQITVDESDFLYEDTIPVYISIPRLVWKILYGCARDTDTSVGEVASEWLSDVGLQMFQNIKTKDSLVNKIQEKMGVLNDLEKMMSKIKNKT